MRHMTQKEFLSLKPGDKVRVMPDYTDEIHAVDFIAEMEEYMGEEVIISTLPEDHPTRPDIGFGRVCVVENPYQWCACEFQSRTIVSSVNLEEFI